MLPPTKPAFNQLEVTLIGPGYGECIVLHYGASWLVIDSCRHLNKSAAALVYLASIGVSPEDIKLIACTHWHDDHCAGLADLLRAAINCEFVLSGALQCREFFNLISSYVNAENSVFTSGVDEIGKAADIFFERDRVPIFARSDQVLWKSPDQIAGLHSLSPSDAMILQSYANIAKMVPSNWGQIKRPIPTENHVSVAMVFVAGSHSVLLGSDLEEHGSVNSGWSAIIASNKRPMGKSSLYKVAHHGSETGEHAGVWTDLLLPGPTSLITPFSKLVDPLPRSGDRSRIKNKSAHALLTTDVLVKRIKRQGATAKLLAPHKVRILNPAIGAVRCRIDSDNPNAAWLIEKSSEVVSL